MSSALYGLVGGLFAWFATTFLAQPIYRFWSLRTEAAKVLALYEDRDRSLSQDVEWLARRRREYELCGAELIGFAYSNSLFTRAFHWLPWRQLRVDPRRAGGYFLTLAELSPGWSTRDQVRDDIMSALKLKYLP
jgi:hypothetical protein